MPKFKFYGDEISSVFQLMGYKENDISHSTAWVLGKCEPMLKAFIKDICGSDNFNNDNVEISVQVYDKDCGITDIEITDNKEFYIIIEAKRGWILPSKDQLLKYSTRESFIKSLAANKLIVTLSECSRDYAKCHLEVKEANGIDIKHISWKDIHEYAETAYSSASHSSKKLLRELQLYLRGLMIMQSFTSNEVYVVSASKAKPDNCELTWIDIIEKKNKYFHPIGGSGWPKDPPNYIAFRYSGKLQSIHHVESYVISKNLHNEIEEFPDKEEEIYRFVYNLGPAIVPPKIIKSGNLYRGGRVWCHLDTLFTCDTISEARDLTQTRMKCNVVRGI